jgi:hypothetical protein
LRPGHVHIVVLEPIPTAGLNEQHRQELVEKVRGLIARELGQPADPDGKAAVPIPAAVSR